MSVSGGRRHRQYRHRPNERINGNLSLLCIVALSAGLGLGVGHFIGSTKERHYQRAAAHDQTERLRSLQDDLVQCVQRYDDLEVTVQDLKANLVQKEYVDKWESLYQEAEEEKQAMQAALDLYRTRYHRERHRMEALRMASSDLLQARQLGGNLEVVSLRRQMDKLRAERNKLQDQLVDQKSNWFVLRAELRGAESRAQVCSLRRLLNECQRQKQDARNTAADKTHAFSALRRLMGRLLNKTTDTTAQPMNKFMQLMGSIPQRFSATPPLIKSWLTEWRRRKCATFQQTAKPLNVLIKDSWRTFKRQVHNAPQAAVNLSSHFWRRPAVLYNRTKVAAKLLRGGLAKAARVSLATSAHFVDNLRNKVASWTNHGNTIKSTVVKDVSIVLPTLRSTTTADGSVTVVENRDYGSLAASSNKGHSISYTMIRKDTTSSRKQNFIMKSLPHISNNTTVEASALKVRQEKQKSLKGDKIPGVDDEATTARMLGEQKTLDGTWDQRRFKARREYSVNGYILKDTAEWELRRARGRRKLQRQRSGSAAFYKHARERKSSSSSPPPPLPPQFPHDNDDDSVGRGLRWPQWQHQVRDVADEHWAQFFETGRLAMRSQVDYLTREVRRLRKREARRRRKRLRKLRKKCRHDVRHQAEAGSGHAPSEACAELALLEDREHEEKPTS